MLHITTDYRDIAAVVSQVVVVVVYSLKKWEIVKRLSGVAFMKTTQTGNN